MTTLVPTSFDFYIEGRPPDKVIGLQVNAADGAVRIPMAGPTAGDICAVLQSLSRAVNTS
jgi:hypothetical protein